MTGAVKKPKDRGGQTQALPSKASPSFAEEYSQVVERAQLATINLIHSDFHIVPKYFELVREGDLSTEAFRYGHKDGSFSYDPNRGACSVEFEWAVTVSLHGEAPLLNLNATYLVVYTDLGSHGAPVVERFARKVGRFACFPFFRTFVSQMSWAANAELPILPILKEDVPKR